MIIQAYLTKREAYGLTETYGSEYEYVTDSYDFEAYQSMDTHNRSNQRGFTYDKSIDGTSESQEERKTRRREPQEMASAKKSGIPKNKFSYQDFNNVKSAINAREIDSDDSF